MEVKRGATPFRGALLLGIESAPLSEDEDEKMMTMTVNQHNTFT